MKKKKKNLKILCVLSDLSEKYILFSECKHGRRRKN